MFGFGSQAKYEEDTTGHFFANTIMEYVGDQEQEQALQRKLVQAIRNCPRCGKSLAFESGTNHAYCRSCKGTFDVSCPDCGKQLKFEDRSRYKKDPYYIMDYAKKGGDRRDFMIPEFVYCCGSCGREYNLPFTKTYESTVVRR